MNGAENNLQVQPGGAGRSETMMSGGVESGVKDCSVVGMEGGAEHSSIIDGVDAVRRSTVSQFQDEEPPPLGHN